MGLVVESYFTLDKPRFIHHSDVSGQYGGRPILLYMQCTFAITYFTNKICKINCWHEKYKFVQRFKKNILTFSLNIFECLSNYIKRKLISLNRDTIQYSFRNTEKLIIPRPITYNYEKNNYLSTFNSLPRDPKME